MKKEYKIIVSSYFFMLIAGMIFYAGLLFGTASTMGVSNTTKKSLTNPADINIQVKQQIFNLDIPNRDYPVTLEKRDGNYYCVKNNEEALQLATSLTPYISNMNGIFTITQLDYYTTVAFYQNSVPNEGYPVEKLNILNCNFLTDPTQATLSIQGVQKVGMLSNGASNLSLWEAVNKIKELGIFVSGYYGSTSAEILSAEFSENNDFMEIKETVRSTPMCDSDQCASIPREYTTYVVVYRLDKKTNELFVITPKVPYWN